MNPDIINSSQLVLVCLSIISTGFIGILLYVVGRALKSLDTMQTGQTALLVTIAAMQEQIKTLFGKSEDHAEDIGQIESHLHGYARRR